jgi:hypothetical protein
METLVVCRLATQAIVPVLVLAIGRAKSETPLTRKQDESVKVNSSFIHLGQGIFQIITSIHPVHSKLGFIVLETAQKKLIGSSHMLLVLFLLDGQVSKTDIGKTSPITTNQMMPMKDWDRNAHIYSSNVARYSVLFCFI